MSLSIGIVGLPNVGKSTLFNALSKRQNALVANYPFATIEPNIGIVDVPDERLEALAELVRKEFSSKNSTKEIPEKIIPAVIKFYDIAGLVKGASQGEGLGNKFLAHIREVDAIIHLVRDFEDDNIIQVGSVQPSENIEVINTELIIADLETLDKRIVQHEAVLKKFKNDENTKKMALYQDLHRTLNSGKLANSLKFDELDALLVKDLNLLTLKPMITVFNVSEDNLSKNLDQNPTRINICAKVEFDLLNLEANEQLQYMKELGITEPGLNKIIRAGYDMLGLQTYLTAGPKEVRAWTIKKGTKAPQAAGVIHTDFEKGFISAEIVAFTDLVAAAGWKGAKEQGLLRLEGRNYTMVDGDVVEFRFSV